MQPLVEKFRPRTLDQFVGLDKPKRILGKLQSNPFPSSWLFVGNPGTGKTTAAMALAETGSFEFHHVASCEANIDQINKVFSDCQYVPAAGKKFHLVLVDETDTMSKPAQNSLLSKLDSTRSLPNVVWIFTANSIENLEPRFLSRVHQVDFSSYGMSSGIVALLERVWNAECPGKPAPNFALITKNANNNVRGALVALETEIMLAE